MTIKNRNHYIPKTYLEKFLNENEELFIYKKGEDFFDNSSLKSDRLLVVKGKDGLNNIAVKKKLYIPEGDLTEDKNIFEDFFNQEVEEKYNEFVSYVDYNFFDAEKIFSKYRDYIILLISSMLSRTLHSKAEMEEIHKMSFQSYHWAQSFDNKQRVELKNHLKMNFPDLTDEEAEKNIIDYLGVIEKGEFGIKLPRNLFIKHIFENLKMYSEIISDMTIQILRAEGGSYFITSDVPVVYFVPEHKVNFYFSHKSLGGPDTELFFPLTKNLCLFLSRRETPVLSGIPVDKSMVDIVNYNLAHNSRDYIFSSYKGHFLEKFIDNYIPYPFVFRKG